jgi:hypothetical protein
MRALVFAAVLLGSSSLYPSYAQDEEKTEPVAAPQAQDKENTAPQQDQRTQTGQPKADNREVGRNWRIHPSDSDRRDRDDRMGRDDREMGCDGRMHRDREADRDRDMDRGRYRERGDRDVDRRDRDSSRYYDDDRSRRRVKVCVEYENGDEYCRYREGR